MIRVLLAEDQDLVRGAMAALLSMEPDIEVVAEIDRGDEVLTAALQSQPDVALLDIEMPGVDGIAAAELAVAIRRTARGERVLDPQLAAQALSDGDSPLSSREAEVLVSAVDGSSAADVARRLFLSEGTVRNHLSAAIQKLGARNRMEAARIAREKGWI